MAYDPIITSEIQVKKPVTRSLMTKIKDCLDYLYGAIGTAVSGGLQNGSFEVVSSGDVPDGWALTTYPGGSGAVITDTPAHGARAFRFVHPGGAGNGGGYLESDYFPVTHNKTYTTRWLLWSSVSGMRVQVLLRWFDKDKVTISDTTIFDSTTTSSIPAAQAVNATSPTNARFCKIRLVGGATDVDVAGSIYFDGVECGTDFECNYQVFASSGTWPKPTTGSMVKIEMWGGGGGYDSTTGNGGGGGEYATLAMPLSLISTSTVSVTVGSGGGMNTNGGTSSFGSYLSAAGGYNGNNGSSFGGAPGGGTTDFRGGSGGYNDNGDPPVIYAGGSATYGAGGGAAAGGSGGGSKYGGAGGDGGASGSSGTAPGGGGGYSGSGARGEVRVTVW